MSEELQIINQQLFKAEHPDFNYQEILKKILPVVNHLLDSDMNSLMNILYRVDVNENKVKRALATGEPDKIGEMIAKLILDRQIEKIKFRKKYSEEKPGGNH